MKNIKNLIKTIIFNIALGISKTFKLSYHQGIGEFYSYSFFLDFGPKILIIRNSKVFFLGNAFSLEANLDKDGNILFILPRFMTTQKNDLVFYGREIVYREYEKYSRSNFSQDI